MQDSRRLPGRHRKCRAGLLGRQDDDQKDPNAQNPDPQGANRGDGGADAGDDAGSSTGADDSSGDDDGSGEGKGKTFTQAELDAIVNARIAKAKKAAAKEAKAELERERERANMDEAERVKAEKVDAEKRIADLEARVRESRVREQLAGRVINIDDAVRVMPSEFIDDDTGEVDVDGFLESRPYFRNDRNTAPAGSSASPGNPPKTKRLTREQIADMSEKEIESRWDEVKEVLGGAEAS